MRSITQKSITRRTLLSGCAVLALVLSVSGTGHGADGRSVAYLTFNQPVALPGTVLPAGAYTFEAVRPDIVRVSSRNGLRVFYAGFTQRVRRPARLGRDVLVAFGEGPAGEPAPITTWYPALASLGHEFLYR